MNIFHFHKWISKKESANRIYSLSFFLVHLTKFNHHILLISNRPFKSVNQYGFRSACSDCWAGCLPQIEPPICFLAIFMMYKVYSLRFQPFPESGPRSKRSRQRRSSRNSCNRPPKRQSQNFNLVSTLSNGGSSLYPALRGVPKCQFLRGGHRSQ